MATVAYDDRSFTIDGHRIWLVSGAVHYFRTPEGLWRDRLTKASRGGLNCIETYVPWNLHEPEEGQWDFDGDKDVVEFIKQATGDLGNLEVVPFNSLLTDFARENNASVIIKGLRAVSDFEFELQMGLMNRTLDESIETLFMIPSQEYSFLSSNLVKEISRHGGDTDNLVPEGVALALKNTRL